MKKIKKTVFALFLMIIVGFNNVYASEPTISIPSSDWKMSELASSSISEVSGKIYLDGVDITTKADKILEDGYVVFRYRDTVLKQELKSYYQKDDTNNYYKHVKNRYYVDGYYLTNNFDYDKNKCEDKPDFISGNCTDNYRVNELTTNLSDGRVFKNLYPKNATRLYHYEQERIYIKKDNKLYNTLYIKITRDGKLGISKVQKYEYLHKKGNNQYGLLSKYTENKYKANFEDPNGDDDDASTVEIIKNYYSTGKLNTTEISKPNFKIKECEDSCYYREFYEKRTYYKNNNLKYKYVEKQNKNRQVISKEKVLYKTNGKKTNGKHRIYSKGKVKYQYIYKYNKSGVLKSKASRIKVTYNKKGKAISARYAKYSKKGKLLKSKIIKIKSSITKW